MYDLVNDIINKKASMVFDVFSSYTKDNSGFPPGCFIIKP